MVCTSSSRLTLHRKKIVENMPSNYLSRLLQLMPSKDEKRNLLCAFFHMMSITFLSMSQADLSWFVISGEVCVPYLTLGQFYWFGYSSDDVEIAESAADYDCINSTIVNLMRITILFCFMAIIFSLGGFFLDIIGPKTKIYRIIRRYAVASTCTVTWIMVIICLSYYIVLLLEESMEKSYPRVTSTISYGFGFYLLVAAGGASLFGIFYTLFLVKYPNSYLADDDECLLDGFEDILDDFNSPTPPPPYNIPPPPYSP